VDARCVQSRTVLIEAAETDGTVELVNRLIQAGAQVGAADDAGMTALMVASERGEAEIVRLLIKAGADMNAVDHQGRTARTIATAAGQTGVLEVLHHFRRAAARSAFAIANAPGGSRHVPGGDPCVWAHAHPKG
jgi:ankyrin repeat protein